jgi:hypothetical protein
MTKFCALYLLQNSQAKYEAVGFWPGDTPEDLASIPEAELKEQNIGTLEWKRLKNAVAEYWDKANV